MCTVLDFSSLVSPAIYHILNKTSIYPLPVDAVQAAVARVTRRILQTATQEPAILNCFTRREKKAFLDYLFLSPQV